MLMDNSAGANLMVTGPAVPAGGFDYVGKVVSGTLKKQ
jgi:hypothetical protein